MITIYPTGMLRGDHFSPAEAERKTGVKFSKKNELGEIGKRGRFIGKPKPYGSAVIELCDPEEGVQGNLRLEDPLIQTLIQHHGTFRTCGATDIHISMAVVYQYQCNMAFDVKLMQALGECNIELWVSCYEEAGDDDDDDDDDDENE